MEETKDQQRTLRSKSRSKSPTPTPAPNQAKKRHLEIRYETKEAAKPSKSPTKDTTDKSYLKKTPRENFAYIIDRIREMRKVRNAPVDMMGAHTNSEDQAPKEVRNFQLLVGVLLSCQTQDKNTNIAVNNLIKVGLTPEHMLEMSEDEILEQIKMVNFNRTKAKNIKKIAKIIIDDYKNKIPETIEELVKLPGIGPKIAVVYLNCALETTVGIGVDTHVHRISNLLGWVKTKDAEETRLALESFVPKEYWNEINVLLIGFGQQVCPSRNPHCEDCLINDVCPEGKRNMRYVKAKGKKVKKNEEDEDKENKIEAEVKVPESIKEQKDEVKIEVKEENVIEDKTNEQGDESKKTKKVKKVIKPKKGKK